MGDARTVEVQLEKSHLQIAFIPIVCSAPLLYAHSRGFFERNGLSVELVQAPGWSGVKELLTYKNVDAAHMPTPMPMACNLGIDGRRADVRLIAVQNVNGQALTLGRQHLGVEDVGDMKGLTFGVPYRFSMQYYLLCHFLAKHGLNPLQDVQIVEVAPPRMPFYLKKGWVDGIFAPEPFNQIPVCQNTGFIYCLSKDIWPGHPCCSLATTQDFIDGCPNTYMMMLKSVLQAQLALHNANLEQKKEIAVEISGPQHLDQEDPLPVQQALTGHFQDGKGVAHQIADRIDFLPCPQPNVGTWILTQMQRWGQLQACVNYQELAERVLHIRDAQELSDILGFPAGQPPGTGLAVPLTGKDPYHFMQQEPYCAFDSEQKSLKAVQLSDDARELLKEVTKHLASAASGNLQARIDVNCTGEIGELQHVFNETLLNMRFAEEKFVEKHETLLEEIQKRQETDEELQKYRLHLEDLVATRTAEIEKTNARLQEEVHERKVAEEALRESEDQFKSISASALEAIVMMDRDGCISYWNEAAEAMFGYSSEEVLARDLHDLVAPERYRQEFWANFPEFKRTGRGGIVGTRREMMALRRDGTEFPIALSVSAVRRGDGWNAIAIVRDITERKRAEERIRSFTAELQEKNRELDRALAAAEEASVAKGQFLANMSHEIRTPINGVIGMAELLLDTELSQDQYECSNTILSSAESLLTVINDILDFSKIESGKLDFENIDFNLRALLEEVLDVLAVHAAKKGLDLVLDMPDSAPQWLRGDPGRLRQILNNLANNAIKFTEAGEVSVRVESERIVDTSVTLRFRVSDTGIGISKAKIASLFDAFSQADASTTRKFGGTGLGLTISKQLTSLMGGEIGVESIEGRGSTFWFTVVLEIGKPASDRFDIEPGELRGRQMLVIDGSATSRKALCGQLESWGCHCHEAGNEREIAEQLAHIARSGKRCDAVFVSQEIQQKAKESSNRTTETSLDRLASRLIVLTRVGNLRQAEVTAGARRLSKPVKQSALYNCLVDLLSHQVSRAKERVKPSPKAEVTRIEETSRVRVLVADDNEVNRKVAVKLLAKLGYNAEAVGDGKEVLRTLQEDDYHLVLMDCQMPEMDGYQATAAVRDGEGPDEHVLIVAMTAHAMKGDRERCLDAGMDDYLTKPIRSRDLAVLMAKYGISPESAVQVERQDEVFDGEAVLAGLDDDMELLDDLAEILHEEAPTLLADIRGAVKSLDFQRIQETAHKLKGMASNFAAKAIVESAGHLEQMGRENDASHIEEALADLLSEYERFEKALDSFLAGSSD